MRKATFQYRKHLALCVCLIVSACGGGGASPQSVPVATPAAVANVLKVQLGALNNQAMPALPA